MKNKFHTTAAPQSIWFTKMHGLGNDFVVIDAINQPVDTKKLPITQLADRHIGIGFDQLLVIEPSHHADFYCQIFNADGSEAEQCGNGLRCVARFIREEELLTTTSFNIETKAGIFSVHLDDMDHVCVTMGSPLIQEKSIPLPLTHYPVTMTASILSVGNPHTIIRVDSIDQIATAQLGSDISSLPLFPHGTNVGFMEIINHHHIRLRTFERGAGETLACGSNACAAACAGMINGWLQHKVEVEFRYGSLFIEWDGNNIRMTGPATHVFKGQIEVF